MADDVDRGDVDSASEQERHTNAAIEACPDCESVRDTCPYHTGYMEGEMDERERVRDQMDERIDWLEKSIEENPGEDKVAFRHERRLQIKELERLQKHLIEVSGDG